MCLSVACPMCQLNLDLRQRDAIKAHGELPETPALYVTQLVGLALGLSADDLGLSALTIGPGRVLEARDAAAGAGRGRTP